MRSSILKKSQVGLLETLMVTVIIVIILVMGIIFYFKAYGNAILQEGERLSMQEQNVLAASIVSMPEFQCTIRSVARYCVDIVKLYSFLSLKDKPIYKNIFGNRMIVVSQIYPPSGDNGCTINGYQEGADCGKWVLYDNPRQDYKSRPIVGMPISLFNPINNRYSIGILTVEDYR
jgi:hypothetical protein